MPSLGSGAEPCSPGAQAAELLGPMLSVPGCGPAPNSSDSGLVLEGFLVSFFGGQANMILSSLAQPFKATQPI